MRRWLQLLPTVVTLTAAGAMLLHGPLVQFPDYNDFADHSLLFGIPRAGDVLSNVAFAIVGVWGWIALRPSRGHLALRDGWIGYRLFLAGVTLIAFGSAYYHLAPDNQRLVWDRLPIAVACAGLLAGVRSESRRGHNATLFTVALTVFGIGSVAWWQISDRPGSPGDLRPYLLLQALPLALIPLWQAGAAASRRDRVWFGAALLLYILAKTAEIADHQILAATGCVSGHTLKHLLAAAAAATLVFRLRDRLHETAVTGGTTRA